MEASSLICSWFCVLSSHLLWRSTARVHNERMPNILVPHPAQIRPLWRNWHLWRTRTLLTPFDWGCCPRRVDACRPAVVFGSCFQVVHARDVVHSLGAAGGSGAASGHAGYGRALAVAFGMSGYTVWASSSRPKLSSRRRASYNVTHR